MPDQVPRLDTEALRRIRSFMHHLQQQRGAVPLRRIAEFSRNPNLPVALTIDFEAARVLGQPLVVVRPDPPPAQQHSRQTPAPHGPDSTAPPALGLTPRECEVAALVADGLSNKHIAARLYISLATVKDHVHRILRKTGLSNRAAIAAAVRSAPSSPAG